MPDDVLPVSRMLGRPAETSRDERTGYHVFITHNVKPARGFRFDVDQPAGRYEEHHGLAMLAHARGAMGQNPRLPPSEVDRAGSAAGGRKSRCTHDRYDAAGRPVYSRIAQVNRRRHEVKALIAEGMNPHAIARRLGCLDGTIRNDIAEINKYHDEGQ